MDTKKPVSPNPNPFQCVVDSYDIEVDYEPTDNEEESDCEVDQHVIETTRNEEQKMSKIIKLSQISIKERLEMRVRKFGIPMTNEIKKQMRAQRFASNCSVTARKLFLGTKRTAEKAKTHDVKVLKKRSERFGVISIPLKNMLEIEKIQKRKLRFSQLTLN